MYNFSRIPEIRAAQERWIALEAKLEAERQRAWNAFHARKK